jgi:amidohydrolase
MSNDWQRALDQQIADLQPRIVTYRRHLHAHPELSGQELETTRYIDGILRQVGLVPRMGVENRGLIVDSSPEISIPRIALRADIDALPIQETRDCPYRSRTPGVMHACGHDGHTATVLAASLALSQVQRDHRLPPGVAWRAIFQPAEETLSGAHEMIAQGAVRDVRAIFSIHMDPSREVGTIGVCGGPFTANCDTIGITIHGHGGHAARPHQTVDPIAAAAQLINALYLYVPRNVDSQEAVVISFGKICAGDADNVIPDQALLGGTLRTLNAQVRERAKAEIERICQGIAAATRTEVFLQWGQSIDGVVNDPHLADIVRRAASEVLGQPADIQEILRPSMGSEDFASYGQHVPCCMFRLGCASSAVGNSGLHTPTFDLDETALSHGARILTRAVVYAAGEITG